MADRNTNPSVKRKRTPMPREQRAKQFAPFDALTGLHARLYKAIDEHREQNETIELVHVDTED